MASNPESSAQVRPALASDLKRILEIERATPTAAHWPQSDYESALVTAQPNDDWQPALEALNAAGRAGKADRFAVAIGSADHGVLNLFLAPALNSNEAVGKLFLAGKERQVHQAFKVISQTAAVRSQSPSPDEKPAIGLYDPAAPA